MRSNSRLSAKAWGGRTSKFLAKAVRQQPASSVVGQQVHFLASLVRPIIV